MKVLQVIPSMNPLHGGPTAAMSTITKSLIEKNVQIDIVTTINKNQNFHKKYLPNHMKKENIGYYYFSDRIFSWDHLVKLKSWLNEKIQQYDIVHIHSVFCYMNLMASRIASQHKIPYVIRPAGMLDSWCMQQKFLKKKIYYDFFEKRNLENASAIHVTSELEKNSLNKLGFQDNIYVIPHGVVSNDLVLRKSPAEEGEMRLLFLGRLNYKKGLEILLEAMNILCHQMKQKIRLFIAGPGDKKYVMKLLQIIKKLNLSDNVIFSNFVEGNQKQKLFNLQHLFILPSYQENFALSVAEALATGMPVIVSDKVGLASDITHFNAGAVIPAGNSEKLAATINAFWTHKKWETCGLNARIYAKQHLSLDILGQNLFNLYTNIKNKKT